MTKKSGIAVGLSLVVLVLAVLAYRAGLIVRYDTDRTVHSPVFSDDGKEVYFLLRTTSGISWGPGIEFFSPPAKVLFLHDRFILAVIDRASKQVRFLHSWDVPHEGMRNEYRNRLFGIPGTELRLKGDSIYYKIGLDVSKDPPNMSVNEWLTGHCDREGKGCVETKKWDRSAEVPDSWTEETLSGDQEVVNFRNRAILLYEEKTNRFDLLYPGKGFSMSALSGVPVGEYSHRRQIERGRRFRETEHRLVAKYLSEGLPEGEAILKADADLEEMGLLPKAPRISAREVQAPSADHALFRISREEFLYGIFPDIEKAIGSKGKEVRFWGNYVSHRDFDTSRKLNSYLAEGKSEFYVQTGGATYLLSVTR